MILGTGVNVRCTGLWLALLLLLCLFVSSWGACKPNPYLQNQINNISVMSPNTSNCYSGWQLTDCCSRSPEICQNNQWPQSGGSCPPILVSWPGYYTDPVEQCQNPSGCNPGRLICAYQILCDTQAEADSVANELTKKDSVLVCINDWSGDPLNGQPIQQQMFLLKCEEGYTKPEDCALLMQVSGTCAQNGYESGEQPKDSTEKTADCFATFQGDCYMMDRATGNTFTCPCENNSCRAALQDVADGTCINPYAPKSSASSSASSSPSSSPSSSDSSPSSSEIPHDTIPAQKVDSSGDWEYDYSGILNAINNNIIDVDNNMNSQFYDVKAQMSAWQEQLQQLESQQLEAQNNIRANTQDIAFKVDYTNTLLKQSVVPAINSAKSGISNKIDSASNKISNTIIAENAKAIEKYNQLIGETQAIKTELTSSPSIGVVDWGNFPDLDTISPDPSISDSLLNASRSSLDSLSNYIDSVYNDTNHNVIALEQIYDYSDSNEIKSKLSKIFFPNSTSGGCFIWEPDIGSLPVVGTLNWKINFGSLFGSLDLCSLTRWIVRLITSIVIIFGTFKAVMSAFGSRD